MYRTVTNLPRRGPAVTTKTVGTASPARFVGAITGRSEGDPRPEEERAAWRKRDPLTILRGVLDQRGILSGESADRITEEVQREIEEAIVFAEEAPIPELSELLTDVYT